MKAVLKFNLSDQDDKMEFIRAQNATSAYLVLRGMDDYLRNKIKYDDSGELETVREELRDLMSKYDINLCQLE